MEPLDAGLVVDSIDIQLVKEQLRLLGHKVDDAVILSFVEGLGAAAAVNSAAYQSHAGLGGCSREWPSNMDHKTEVDDVECSDHDTSVDTTSLDKAAAVSPRQQVHDAMTPAVLMVPEVSISDASPSRSQTDQQSPSSHGLGVTSPKTYDALDQRCRKFLARLSKRPSSQQLKQQHESMANRHVLINSTELPGHADPPSASQDQAHSKPDGVDKCWEGQLTHQRTRTLSRCELSASASTIDALHIMQETERCIPAAECGHNQLTTMHQVACSSRRSSDDLQCLMQLSSSVSQGRPQPDRQLSLEHQRVPVALQQVRGSTSELVPQIHTAATEVASKIDQRSKVVYEAPTVRPLTERQELPLFGFRPGYRPVGIHIPPPLAHDALEFITQTKEAAAGAALQRIVSCQQQCSSVASSLSGLQHQNLVPLLDVRPCSNSILGDVLPTTYESHNAAHRPRHTPHDGCSSTDPLYPAPKSPTCISLPAPTEPKVSVTSAEVIAAAAAHSTSMRKAHGVAGPSADIPASSRGNSKSSSSCISDLRRQLPCISAASVQSIRRIRNSNWLSSQELYSQQLSFGGRCGRGSAVAPGVQKTDRVAKFHQMQQQWQKDRYLSGGVGGSSRSRASSSSAQGSGQTTLSKLHSSDPQRSRR